MFNNEKDLFIQETEEKPNRYALFVLAASCVGIIICWIMDEVGIFRADKTVMRIGSMITLLAMIIPIVVLMAKKENISNPKMKFVVMAASFMFTFATSTLLCFHTTLMLIYPVFVAMLYKSKAVGIFAFVAAIFSTIFSPIFSYLLGIWDVPLFQEMILIATNGDAVIEGAKAGISVISIVKILLYLVFPKLVIIVPCSILMFYVISISSKQVETQIILNRINHVDSMTGLYNQNYYQKVLNDQSFSGPCGVIFFDVNNLKKLNDSQGHELGDLLLKRCAKSLLDISKSDNIGAFRVGGDEFAIIAMNATESDISKMVIEWKKALVKINEENIQLYDGLECSMAYGCAAGNFNSIAALISDADAQMYNNKKIMKAGR